MYASPRIPDLRTLTVLNPSEVSVLLQFTQNTIDPCYQVVDKPWQTTLPHFRRYRSKLLNDIPDFVQRIDPDLWTHSAV